MTLTQETGDGEHSHTDGVAQEEKGDVGDRGAWFSEVCSRRERQETHGILDEEPAFSVVSPASVCCVFTVSTRAVSPVYFDCLLWIRALPE
ncbi:hypothetical protein DPX16_23799 [Anabarilius grahami]|uniref:Uncharacterized protein n=1 Tax=Anabarilius grahami TaxID=495550 RepID=A0A3N0YH30_ANAGA|nr:hypothetical protein DPX16_23799 [Anabarilius grahami]